MRSWAARLAGFLLLALSAAGCNTTGQGFGAGGRTVAFESIDGPPQAVFDRLVRKLDQEAQARQVPVVTREGFAPYRIRGYMAVGVKRGQAVVNWVWDIYDAQAGRSLRLSGEEKAGRAGRDAWAAVSDEVLTRVARSGMEQLSAYFQGGFDGGDSGMAVAQEPAAPATRDDDSRPQPRGVTRRAAAEPAESSRRAMAQAR